MGEIIYFDNSSTTRPSKKAVEYINNALINNWGNPSSLHTMGIEAEQEINLTRKRISKLINCSDDEIYFTASGTEANNIAIKGSVLSRQKRGKRIITTAIEHPSVLENIEYFESQGFEVIKLKPNSFGIISEEDIKNSINIDTILVSIMLVNNEVGSIEPVKAAAEQIKKIGCPALLHCDAVQAFGKMPIDVKKLGIDLLSASGHKIHASKGVGFLYKKKGVNISVTVHGGGQEKGLRSGTESVPLISGLRGAVEDLGNINENLTRQKDLWLYAKNQILSTGLAEINSPDDALPYILNISVNGYRSETLLHFLNSKNIFVSSGSACAKGHKSHVMKALGLSDNRIDSALRLSFSKENTKNEIDIFCSELISACKILRKA